MDGWVAERNISVGERIIALFTGAKLVTLLRINPLRLALTVPQQEMAQIKIGQAVTFQTDAFPGRQFTGAVRYISPAVTADNRSLCIEAVVPNPNAELLPGLFTIAELQLDKKQTDLYVPASAVCNRGDVAAVFVIRGGTIREQIVALGDRDGSRIRILTGLAAGDVVATAPDGLHDGDAAP
jgi:membrane fusion protein (multidrug efflux system)